MHASMPPFPVQERGPCPSPQNSKSQRLALEVLRKQRSALAAPRCSARRSPDSAPFFFLAAQRAFYAARVGRYGEPLLNGSDQSRRADGRVACTELGSEVQNLWRKLVALAGSSFFGQQPHHTIALKIGFRLIVGGTGEAECRSGLTDRVLVHSYATKHLVL